MSTEFFFIINGYYNSFTTVSKSWILKSCSVPGQIRPWTLLQNNSDNNHYYFHPFPTQMNCRLSVLQFDTGELNTPPLCLWCTNSVISSHKKPVEQRHFTVQWCAAGRALFIQRTVCNLPAVNLQHSHLHTRFELNLITRIVIYTWIQLIKASV